MHRDMRRLAAILLPLLIVLALAIWRAQGPAPKPAGAPPAEFSATRAMTNLRELLSQPIAHPVATEANEHVRDFIWTRLRALGYDIQVQRRFACNALPACASVENIFARDPNARGDAVVLVAHYDSVGAGPGASDDGAGVASLLEVARAVRGEHHRNPIAFLITDGEEAGLIGAEAFVADPEFSGNAKLMINVENRGTYGPSNMFETSRNNRWLIRRLAHALERPHATSFFYAIYNLLPNDTDVTVFKRAGKAAVNFAAIGGVNWYHTPLDNLAHVSERTLQHHGDNLLASARAFADADLDARSGDDATYFDVLQFTLIWWPAGATIWIVVVSLALLVYAARKTNPRAMTFGVLATFIAILLAALAGAAVSWIARLHSDGINWVAHPLPSVIAMWLIGIAAAVCGAALFRNGAVRASGASSGGAPDTAAEQAMLFGAALVWHAVAFVLALTLTGVSFLFLVPALAVTICALARARTTAISAVASTAAAILFFPIVILLHDALGGRMIVAIAILIGVLMTLVAPLVARFRCALIAALFALVFAGIAAMLDPASPERPRPISLAYVNDATMPPMWVTPVLTPTLQQAAPFTRASRNLTPWYAGTQWAAAAPPTGAARVEMSAVREGELVTVIVRSPRRANRITLAVRGGTIATVNGVAPAPLSPRHHATSYDGWRFAMATVGTGLPEMTVEIRARGAVELIGSDLTFGIRATSLTIARNASNAVPQHDGDVAITRARMRVAGAQ
jgi:hypothetical protein